MSKSSPLSCPRHVWRLTVTPGTPCPASGAGGRWPGDRTRWWWSTGRWTRSGGPGPAIWAIIIHIESWDQHKPPAWTRGHEGRSSGKPAFIQFDENDDDNDDDHLMIWRHWGMLAPGWEWCWRTRWWIPRRRRTGGRSWGSWASPCQSPPALWGCCPARMSAGWSATRGNINPLTFKSFSFSSIFDNPRIFSLLLYSSCVSLFSQFCCLCKKE